MAVASATTRLALVTGTTSGIGAALAKQLLQRGWEVAGVARRTPTIENPRYHHLAVDLRDVSMAVKSIERKFGPHEWFPFGGGNRVCLGMPFALYEMKVLLATLFSQVRLTRPAGARSRARP